MHIGFILLNSDLGAEEYIVEELKKIPEVKKAYLTFGAYDLLPKQFQCIQFFPIWLKFCYLI